MPVVKLDTILSCSSEHENNKAINISNFNNGSKWTTAKPGEGQAIVIFQLEKSVEINSIDIGNNGSAFVEVFAGRSSQGDAKYEILLVASAFMSPGESRQTVNTSKVRIFDKSKLVPENSCQSWDRIKIVCTQPFNKRITYGLTFVNVHSVPDKDKDEPKEDSPVKFGSFNLKTNTPKAKLSKTPPNKDTKSPKNDYMEVYKILNAANKKESLDISKSEMTICKSVDDAKMLIETKRAKIQRKKDIKKESNVKISDKKRKSSNSDTPKPKHKVKNLTKKIKKQKVPFNEIMKDVKFALSGYVNPLRSDIRNKAISMGAEYKRDWSSDCTHLVCAFKNTPKYKVVLGKGNIVNHMWIDECASKHRLMNWRRHNMDPNQSPFESSESEVSDTEVTSDHHDELKEDAAVPGTSKQEEDPYEASTDDENTDDEIERLKATGQLDVEESNKNEEADDPYEVSTDEECQSNGDELPKLPDHFTGSSFFLYKISTPDKERMIRRHIIVCGGEVEEYMSGDVDYIITEAKWDKSFDEQVEKNTDIKFVKPEWIFHCSHKQTVIPHRMYEVPVS